MPNITLFNIGTKIIISNDINATINGIYIGENHHILYKVVWWDGRIRKDEYITAKEFVPIKDYTTVTIGFK